LREREGGRRFQGKMTKAGLKELEWTVKVPREAFTYMNFSFCICKRSSQILASSQDFRKNKTRWGYECASYLLHK
jgi:hypothetical protein